MQARGRSPSKIIISSSPSKIIISSSPNKIIFSRRRYSMQFPGEPL